MSFKPIAECGLLVVEFETSGLDPARHCPLSVAAIRTDPSGREVHERYTAKIRPRDGAEMDAGALEVNGYTEAAWADAIDGREVSERILTLATDSVFTAHNAPFDWAFLASLIGGQRGWPGPYHKVDTAALAWPLLRTGRVQNVKLETLAGYFGHVNEAAHTADADAEACRAIYVALMDRYSLAFESGQLGLAI